MKLVCIKTYAHKAEAELVKSLLENNGIKAMVSADDCGGMRPHLLWSTGGAKLLVKEKDVKKALDKLKEYERKN